MPQFQPAMYTCPADSTWRFCWYNHNPETNKLQRVRHTFDINRIRDLQERKRVADSYKAMLNEALRAGYNYFVDTLGMQPAQLTPPLPAVLDEPECVSVSTLLKTALNAIIVGKKPRTQSTYTSYHNIFKNWLIENGLNNKPADNFSVLDFQEYIIFKASLGHSNKSINSHLSYFKSAFEKGAKLLKIKNNPTEAVDFLPEHESNMFKEFTAQELQRIAATLRAYNPLYYLYTMFTAHMYIRPYHTARLKVNDLNFEAGLLSLSYLTTKNNTVAKVELLPEVRKVLLQLGYDKIPGNYYIFGAGFKPSATIYESLSNRHAELWRELVIEGLGIDKKMYGLKHTSSSYYVSENDHIDAAWLQGQMQHSSLAETEAYIGKRRVKKINKAAKRIKY